MTNTFRLAPTPALATYEELSGLFRMLEAPLTCPHCGNGHPLDQPCTVFRQRYECACSFHGTRELPLPPSHIKCPRCAGVAVARGRAERVQ